MLENEREECLMHEVTRKFLNVKWQGKGYKLYMANLVLYLMFHVLLNIYVILIRGSVTVQSLEGISPIFGYDFMVKQSTCMTCM